MKRSACAILTPAAIAAIYLTRHAGGASRTIDYHGQTFRAAKKHWSYEDYKDDANNLDSNELLRIEKAMTEASLPSSFDSRKEFIRAMMELKFPGYGFGQDRRASTNRRRGQAWVL